MPASRSRVRGIATASAAGAWKLSAVTTWGRRRSRWRASGAATPTARAPQARVRRARELRKTGAVYAGSRMRTSTGARSAKASASAREPRWPPQFIGTATRGWIRRAASAASPAVIT